MGHLARLRGRVENTFSREQGIHPTLLTTREMLLYTDHVRYIWSRTTHGPSVESV
jgi:hypothetical protein